MRRTGILGFFLLLISQLGCADVEGPDWFMPGTARSQRTRAQRFDPYPDPAFARDDGSARPRDYLHPPPEADRNARSARGLGQPDRWQASGP